MPTTSIKFASRRSEFAADVKQRVQCYFTERGLSDKANAAMVAKTAILLSVTFGSYALILTNQLPGSVMLGFAVVMGVGMAGIGFAISHDALHGAYARSPLVNRFVGLTFDLIGANGYMWRITHNVIHHTYTNIQGVDEDLEISPLIRLSPRSPWRPIHRIQHWLAFVLYSFSTLFWVWVKDYKYFLQRHLGPYQDKRHPPGEVALLLTTKAIYYGWSVGVPLWILDLVLWQFLVGYLAVHLTAGLILGVVFQLAHVVEGPEHPVPDASGQIDDEWLVHQMETTSNFATDNRLVTWYVGGLNYQIEHHLFPRICSVHYPAIRHIVREMAAKYGIPYHHQPTVWSAIRSHYRTLKRQGVPELSPA